MRATLFLALVWYAMICYDFPGINNVWLMKLKDRIEMTATASGMIAMENDS